MANLSFTWFTRFCSCKHHTDMSTYQAYTSPFQFSIANMDMKQMSECLTGRETHGRLMDFTPNLKVHDDGTVIQLLTSWDINHYYFFFVKQHFEGQTLLLRKQAYSVGPN